MHILEIPSFFPPLGGEFCIEQSKALRALGHEVRILSCNPLGVTIDWWRYLTGRWNRWEEQVDDVYVYRSNVRTLPKGLLYNQSRWCAVVAEMYADYRQRFGRPDVLHAHCCLWAGVAARQIAAAEDIPYYITEHLSSGLFPLFRESSPSVLEAKRLIREAYRQARMVIPVSAELVDDLVPYFGRDYAYRPISNIVDTSFFAYRDRMRASGVPFRFCCLARADIYGKGYDVLRDAFEMVSGAELFIAGRNTQSAPMRNLMAGADRIHLLGELSRDQVRTLLYQCDALVLASRSEAQPLVLLEAMATGIPVVATSCTPQSERIPGACLIAAIGDAHSLASRMQEVMQVSPSRNISEQVRAMASPDAVGRQLESLFLSPLEE